MNVKEIKLNIRKQKQWGIAFGEARREKREQRWWKEHVAETKGLKSQYKQQKVNRS